MTRKFSFSRLNSLQRSRSLAALLAVTVVSSSCGVSSSHHAAAQSSGHSNHIRQVAGGGRSGGLLSGLFGRGSSDEGHRDEPYRKATAVPSDRDVNWSGIPYHNPHESRITSNPRAPIHDPGANNRRATSAPAPRPTAGMAPRTRSAVPTPPPVATATPRKLPSKIESGATAHISSSGRPEPLSVTQSSRRPPKLEPRSPTTHRESARTAMIPKPRPTSAAVDVKPVELVPNVSRKVIKSVSPTAVAKQTAAPAEEDVAATATSSQPGGEMPPESPRKISTTDAPQVSRREIASAVAAASMPTANEKDEESSSATDRESLTSPVDATTSAPALASADPAPESAVASASPTASLGTPTLALPADDADENASTVTSMAAINNDRKNERSSGSLVDAGDTTVALHPISDRLPIEDASGDPSDSHTQRDSQLAAQDDAFGPRALTAAGTTKPNYHNTGYGHNELGKIPDANEDEDPVADSLADEHEHAVAEQPNAMRTATQRDASSDSKTSSGSNAAVPAVGVAANANTSASELPGIRVVTNGPRRVTIRQTHTYEIRVENRGSVDAEGLIVHAHIPDWADVVSQEASRGDVEAATQDSVRNLNWQIDRLDAGRSETLNVRLKAARSGTHDLDVTWTLAPQKRIVQVTVQEPELALTIDGPDEVVFGESKTYQIRVLNSGDGIAPEVVFTLSPDSSSPQSQRIGDIPAGKEAQFEVELTAQDLGELKIQGLAVGDLELKAKADKTVRVLAADLEAVLSGPDTKYQDTEAIYQLELTNQGTAASENVVATVQLPVGVTYLGGLEGATMIDSQLRWKIASLPPGAVREYEFRCSMDSTGQHQFEFDCKGSAAGHTTVSLGTNVEAIADLVLSVEDPSAPAPVGQDVTYQILIHNRGSKPALDVQAIAQFSTGIEPKQITGQAGKVVTGQVLVDPIERIEGGQEVRMTIVARAETGGHHRFRAEVRSGDTVLVAEEATHFLAPKTQRITRRSGVSAEQSLPPVR